MVWWIELTAINSGEPAGIKEQWREEDQRCGGWNSPLMDAHSEIVVFWWLLDNALLEKMEKRASGSVLELRRSSPPVKQKR